MTARRVPLTVATLVAAVAVALAVPVSQLRIVSVVVECCCPDPENCHCPDHQPDHSTQSTMRACHRTAHDVVAPQLPSFSPPEVALAIAPPRADEIALLAMPEPHTAPSPGEPYGPS